MKIKIISIVFLSLFSFNSVLASAVAPKKEKEPAPQSDLEQAIRYIGGAALGGLSFYALYRFLENAFRNGALDDVLRPGGLPPAQVPGPQGPAAYDPLGDEYEPFDSNQAVYPDAFFARGDEAERALLDDDESTSQLEAGTLRIAATLTKEACVILVAEDCKMNQLRVKSQLKRAGFNTENIVIARDADELLAIIKASADTRFHVILMDNNMPWSGVDPNNAGLHMVKAIRELEAAGRRPVPILMHSDKDIDAAELESFGADGKIFKTGAKSEQYLEEFAQVLLKYGVLLETEPSVPKKLGRKKSE
jgi:CheY-like chemotaxis protein